MAQTVGQTVVQGLVEDERVPADSDRPRGRLGRPRRDAGEAQLISEEMARRLVEQAREEGVDITGDGGLSSGRQPSANSTSCSPAD